MDGPSYLERLRAIDPRVEPVVLPFSDGSWAKFAPADPHPEPPPWGDGLAAERRAALERAHALIALHTPEGLMDLAPQLRFVQGMGAGIEQFGRAGVPHTRVTLCNASGLSSGSMAEFVIGRLLQLWKRFPEIDAYQRERKYEQAYGRTFRGSTLGIVGLGHIGRAIGERVRALGVHVLAMRRSEPDEFDRACIDEAFRPDRLHEMLSRCDAVVVCAPETPQTRNMMDAKALAAMPKGSVLVNVARGALVDDTALLEALKSGHLGAAVLDVFREEPLPPESPLWSAPNLYASAHCSVSTDRYVDDAFDLFEENLGRYLRGDALRNLVDTEAMGFPAP